MHPDEDYYFDSYSHFGIHREMLSDKIRTLSYKEAIFKNESLIKGKVILDVGCGTGILSLFAAKCGAKVVYAVEKSSIVEYAKQIIEKNGFSDKVKVIQGAMEEIEIPEKVDVIISEWMGYCLLYESMLPSVILARDKFMSSSGTMFPSKAKMYISAIEDSQYYKRKISFWDDVCGFNFKPVKDWALIEPLISTCPEKQIVTDDSTLIEFDLNKVKADQLAFKVPFNLNPLEPINFHAFVVWFDVLFEGPDATILLTTSPFETPTHWTQTIFYLNQPIPLDDGFPIEGTFEMHPNSVNPRDQDITIEFKVNGKNYKQNYKMR